MNADGRVLAKRISDPAYRKHLRALGEDLVRTIEGTVSHKRVDAVVEHFASNAEAYRAEHVTVSKSDLRALLDDLKHMRNHHCMAKKVREWLGE